MSLTVSHCQASRPQLSNGFTSINMMRFATPCLKVGLRYTWVATVPCKTIVFLYLPCKCENNIKLTRFLILSAPRMAPLNGNYNTHALVRWLPIYQSNWTYYGACSDQPCLPFDGTRGDFHKQPINCPVIGFGFTCFFS